MAIGMTIQQGAAIFNEIAAQATGRKDLGNVDATNFVSIAETVLRTGTDPLMGAISQVLTKTIVSVRPYYAKFKGLRRDSEKWGNHIRKLVIIDSDAVDNDSFKLEAGEPVPDQWDYRPAKTLQTNYYGQDTYADYVSIPVMQLNTAFESLAGFTAWISGVMQNIEDRFTQRQESADRLCIANMVAAKTISDSRNVYNLLTLYYQRTGHYLTPETYAGSQYYDDFCKWLSAFIKTLSRAFEDRTTLRHANVTIDGVAFDIPRHTPKADQHLYLYSPEMNDAEARVLADTFNPELAKIGDFEKVNFWQSSTPGKEMSIKVKPEYIDESGESTSSSDYITIDNLFGILFDTEAMGVTDIYKSIRMTPINARTEHYDVHWHLNQRYYNDLTENCAVLLLAQTEEDPSYMHISPDELTVKVGGSGVINVTHPQSSVTATVDTTAAADGVTASYSSGKVTVAVAGTASVESATVTITDGTTTYTVSVTIEAAAEAKRAKK